MARLAGEADVLDDGQPAEEVGDLERARQAAPRSPGDRDARDVLAEERRSGRRRAQLARDEAEERRLAGAVRPDDADALGGTERERDAVDRGDAPEAADEPVDAEGGRAALARSDVSGAGEDGEMVMVWRPVD